MSGGSDGPYTDAGDLATIELDDLPGLKFQAPVARTAGAQDPNTRLMRVEIPAAPPAPSPAGKGQS